MISTEQHLYTVDEYLELEAQSEVKHEYVDGILIEMPGESKKANKIAFKLAKALDSALAGQPYDVFNHDVKLRTDPDRKYRYPDVMVVPISDQEDSHMVYQAVLTAEITSENSLETDTHTKLLEYSALPSVQCYLIVAQTEPLIEVYQRTGTKWEYAYYTQLSDSFDIMSLGITLALNEVYEGVAF
ncbi:MAG: Uma2 family endonuclease [Bacteroidetes bacterium]|nr:Uma2 family endonuclease [Fibrella sp.]